MTVQERITEFVKYKNLSLRKFEQQSGLSNGYIKNIVNSISTKKLDDIVAAFPELNKTWVLLGEGTMLNPSPDNKNNAEFLAHEDATFEIVKKIDSTEFRAIGNDRYLVVTPLINQYGYAGYVSGWADEEYVEELPRHAVIMKELNPGIYRSVEVKGDSMDNGLKGCIADGDIVTGRKLSREYWINRLHLHKYKNYILVTKDGILIKEIIEHKVEEGILVCHSLNPDRESYPDFEVHLDDVNEIFYIKAVTEPYR